VKEFSVSISTGNCFGLHRSRDDVIESLEIVSSGDGPYLFDAFSFVASEMDAYDGIANNNVLAEDVLVGTSTMIGYNWSGSLVGGLVVSVPWQNDLQPDDFFNSYKSKFGESLAETFYQRPSFESGETYEQTIKESFNELFNIDVFQVGTVSSNGAEISVIGFTSDETMNLLYIVSEVNINGKDWIQSLLRQLDTLLVFESPKSVLNVDGTAIVPCKRILSSPQLQSYEESTFELSSGVHLNLGTLDSPEIFIDSVLEFTAAPDFADEVLVRVVSSRNATKIEDNLRSGLTDTKELSTQSLTCIKSGITGDFQSRNIFIGELYVDWSCGCETSYCPSVLVIESYDPITVETIKNIDAVLTDVDGQEPFEFTIGNTSVNGY